MTRSLTFLFLIAGLALSSSLAEEWSYSYPVSERDAFASADFALNLDPAVSSPKAVIVLIGAQDVDMRKSIRSSPWGRVAKQQEAAVLGCYFVNKPDSDFSRVDSGGRSALLASLVEFSKKSEALRDLDRLKLVLVGRLAGAQFAYEFAARESDRIASFICINPYYFNVPPTGALRRIPGFFMVSENEYPIAAQNVKRMYEEQRGSGALWGRVFWDNSARRNLDLDMAAPFIEQTIISRVDRKNPITALVDFNLNKGWSLDLSQTTVPTITESKNVPRGKEEGFAWFSTELLAESVAKLMVAPQPAKRP